MQLKKQAKGTSISDQMMLCRPCPDFSLYPAQLSTEDLRLTHSPAFQTRSTHLGGCCQRATRGRPHTANLRLQHSWERKKAFTLALQQSQIRKAMQRINGPRDGDLRARACCGARGRVGYSHTCAKLSPDKGESLKVISVYQNEFIYTSNMMPQRKQQSTTANQRVGAIW